MNDWYVDAIYLIQAIPAFPLENICDYLEAIAFIPILQATLIHKPGTPVSFIQTKHLLSWIHHWAYCCESLLP